MGITTIGDAGASAAATAASSSLSIGTALLAEVQTAQVADVEKLFGSLGLGTNANSVA